MSHVYNANVKGLTITNAGEKIHLKDSTSIILECNAAFEIAKILTLATPVAWNILSIHRMSGVIIIMQLFATGLKPTSHF